LGNHVCLPYSFGVITSTNFLIKDLDVVLDRAGSLEEFLSRADLIDAYFDASQAYYGAEKFPRSTYDSILAQVRATLAIEPTLGERLWRKIDALQWSFTLDCEKAVARNVFPKQWLQYLDEWSAKLESEFSDATTLRFSSEGFAYAEKILISATNEISDFRRDLAKQKLTTKKAREKERIFFEELTNRPEIKQIAAWYLHTKLSRTHIRSQLTCEDGDVIIAKLRAWRNDPKKVVLSGFAEYSEPILARVRDLIPSTSELKDRTDLFPRKVSDTRDAKLFDSDAIRAGRYYFEALPRYFHGAFRGVAVSDCCTFEAFRAEVHPARWLVGCVENSQTIHITSGHKYYGSVLILPVNLGSEKYGLVEFWSQLLAAQAVVDSTEKKKSMYLAHWLVSKINSLRPPNWKGICYCNDVGFDNWSVIRLFQRGLFSYFTKQIGVSSQLTINDDLCVRSSSHISRGPRSGSYPPGLIFSGRTKPDLAVIEPDFNFD
jgi:hypothetical protein